MDEFIPANQTSIAPPATVEVMPAEVQATMKQAEVVQDPRFMTLMQFVAIAKQTIQTVKVLETGQDQANAIVFFDRVKKALGTLEDFRHEVVDVPTKFTQLVNAMFRLPRQDLEAVKFHFSTILGKYDARLRAEAEVAKKEAQEKGPQAQEPLPLEDGMATVPMEAYAPVPPPTTTKVEGTNAKVTMRDTVEMEIVDPVKLLKAICSDSERNKAYTLDLIEFKIGKIKELCTGRRKIPGVEWEIKKKAV